MVSLPECCQAACMVQELLLRLVEDYYPLPSNPSHDPSTTPTTTSSRPHSASSKPNGTASDRSAGSAERLSKKRKRGKPLKEPSTKPRRTKKSVKAGKGIQETCAEAEVTAEVTVKTLDGRHSRQNSM